MNGFINFPYLLPTPTNLSYFFPIISLQQTLNRYTYLQTIPSTPDFTKCIPYQNIPTENSDEEILPDFRCKLCSLTIPSFAEFQQHMTSHETGESSSTESTGSKQGSHTDRSVQASSRNPDEILVTEKSTTADGMTFRCSYCPGIFKDNSSVLEHMDTVHDDGKEIVCVICKSTFLGIAGLRKHLLMYHCKNKDRRQCTYCPYKCYQSSDLEKHIARKHTRDFKYKCSKCIKGFATPKELKNHLKRKHFHLKVTKMEFEKSMNRNVSPALDSTTGFEEYWFRTINKHESMKSINILKQ